MTGKYGLIGRSLSHSVSPLIHKVMSGMDYRIFDIEKNSLSSLIKDSDAEGFNVTIPYKRDIIEYLDCLDPVSKKTGAVNTVVRREGKLFGFNTDYQGFIGLLNAEGIDPLGKKVAVLGSGATSSTVVCALKDLGASETVIVSRSGPVTYGDTDKFRDCRILVNTTPVGMYPDSDSCPSDLDVFESLEAVVDVVYNPLRTRLVLEAEKRRIKAAGGLKMLIFQAALSSYLFTGTEVPEERITNAYREVLKNNMSICLIGMPGSGKTVVGRELALRLNKKFYDLDEEFAEKYSTTPEKYIIIYGESDFREKESALIKELSEKKGIVLSSGGGAVETDENFFYLRKNSLVVYLTRDLHSLAVSGRPISERTGIETLLKRREDKYKLFSDITSDNDSSVGDAAERIINMLEGEERF